MLTNYRDFSGQMKPDGFVEGLASDNPPKGTSTDDQALRYIDLSLDRTHCSELRDKPVIID